MGVVVWITNPHIWIVLVTLTSLEIVLGIDNIVLIAILQHGSIGGEVGDRPSEGVRRSLLLRLEGSHSDDRSAVAQFDSSLVW